MIAEFSQRCGGSLQNLINCILKKPLRNFRHYNLPWESDTKVGRAGLHFKCVANNRAVKILNKIDIKWDLLDPQTPPEGGGGKELESLKLCWTGVCLGFCLFLLLVDPQQLASVSLGGSKASHFRFQVGWQCFRGCFAAHLGRSVLSDVIPVFFLPSPSPETLFVSSVPCLTEAAWAKTSFFPFFPCSREPLPT